MANVLKRLDGATFRNDCPLAGHVTQHTGDLFDVIAKNGKNKAAAFLDKDPGPWDIYSEYQEMQLEVRQMKVINDCAERALALITTYNSSITKDGQKQFLLRLVDLHRKEYPEATKASLMKK